MFFLGIKIFYDTIFFNYLSRPQLKVMAQCAIALWSAKFVLKKMIFEF
jgi:hypothetical protein